jgi:hypothetical protein
VLDFGTSGKLRYSNLIMYDRQTESWWQEMGGEAIVGDRTGQKLDQLYLSIVSWDEFKASFPDGKTLSRDTGHSRPYGSNPYAGYDQANPFLYRGPIDSRLNLMERVVGVTIADESIAVPFTLLAQAHVVHHSLNDQDLVVFFKEGTASPIDSRYIPEGRDVGATGVFDPNLAGRMLTFTGDGAEITDDQTGSAWDLFGKAVSGPLKGKQLTAIPNSGSQLWFSWAVYRPNTLVFGN